MKKKLIPNHVMQYIQKNPQIGRKELAKLADIPETTARFYCRAYAEMNTGIKYKSRGVALFDIHYPVHDKACMNVIEQFLRDFKPNYLVYGGDQMQMDTISSFNIRKPKLIEGKRIKREYIGFQVNILDRFEDAIPKRCKKFFMVGNHEYRIERLIEKTTQFEGFIELEANLKLDDYTIIPFNDIFNIGDMYFAHGMYWNKYFSEKTLSIVQKMIFVGHVHTPQVYTGITPIYSLPKQCVGVGCLCNINPEYMENKPNHWVHQFLFWYMMDDGTFTYFTPIIINGRCIINGKMYDGNIGLEKEICNDKM